MALSAFNDKSRQPQDSDLAEMLGGTYVLWNHLQGRIATMFDPLSMEWGYNRKTTGWGLRLKQEKRAILYMIPCKGYFLASFALGEKVVRAEAQEAALAARVSATTSALLSRYRICSTTRIFQRRTER